jgi:hypothetical protein
LQHRCVGDLQGEGEVAVKVLVQAVEVAWHVLQQQRGWPDLASIAALLQKVRVRRGIALLEPHARVPVVGDIGQTRVESRAQTAHQVGEWVFKIPVFAFTETVPGHVDVAAEITFVWIQPRYLATLIR